MVLHAPMDDTVSINEASKIFVTAKHPKSFLSLDGGDHLLTREEDSLYVGSVIASWAKRFIDPISVADDEDQKKGISSTGKTSEGFYNIVSARTHRFIVDDVKKRMVRLISLRVKSPSSGISRKSSAAVC